jgi:hypothetical protein
MNGSTPWSKKKTVRQLKISNSVNKMQDLAIKSMNLKLTSMRLILFAFLILSQVALAQKNNLEELNLKRYQQQQKGMTALTTWASANIVTGTMGYFMSDNAEVRYFHEMNVIWNSVNLGLGIAGLATTKRPDASLSREASLKAALKTERIFLVNAGLDILYMGGGLAMRLTADNAQNPDRMRGYGNSLLLQGGFLFLFDGIEYFIHRKIRKSYLKKEPSISLNSQGIGFSLRYTF